MSTKKKGNSRKAPKKRNRIAVETDATTPQEPERQAAAEPNGAAAPPREARHDDSPVSSVRELATRTGLRYAEAKPETRCAAILYWVPDGIAAGPGHDEAAVPPETRRLWRTQPDAANRYDALDRRPGAPADRAHAVLMYLGPNRPAALYAAGDQAGCATADGLELAVRVCIDNRIATLGIRATGRLDALLTSGAATPAVEEARHNGIALTLIG